MPDNQPPILEFEAWQNIIHSEDWRVFVRVLKTHKEYLQGRVNRHLEKHEDRKAGEELAKMRDCDNLLKLVETRIAELRKQTEK
jgi:hypothetical protein